MKLIRGGVTLVIACILISCGGSSHKEKEVDTADIKTENTADADSTKLAAGSYHNEELGYSITYPKDVLIIQEESKTSDKLIFIPKEGKAQLAIYKDVRKDKGGKELTFNEAFEQDRATTKKRQVSYSSLNPLFYALSGVEGNEIFYQKTIIAKGAMVTAKLTYTKEGKPTYDAMIAPLFNSFK